MTLQQTMAEDAQPTPPGPGPSLLEGDRKLMSLLGQFFLLPFLIALTSVGIFVGIRVMTADEKDPLALLREMRLQRGSARWQIAYDLNSRLVADPRARKDPRLVPEIARAWKEIEPRDEDDARTRTWLVTILGTLRDPAGLPVILAAIHDRDGATQVAAIQSAGSLAEPAVLPDLLQLAESDDAGLRKAAVFALGLFNPRRRAAEHLPAVPAESDARILAAVRKAHGDRSEDVRWNAALALSRFGASEAAPTLAQMLDRDYLRRISESSGNSMTEEMQADVMVNAMKGVLQLNDANFGPILEKIQNTDRSLDVRQAARTILESLRR